MGCGELRRAKSGCDALLYFTPTFLLLLLLLHFPLRAPTVFLSARLSAALPASCASSFYVSPLLHVSLLPVEKMEEDDDDEEEEEERVFYAARGHIAKRLTHSLSLSFFLSPAIPRRKLRRDDEARAEER